MAVRSSVAEAEARPLTVWYDGDCPICTAEIGLMRRLDRASAIEFVDLSRPGACPTDHNARLARLHVQVRGGPMLAGAAAFVAIWRVLPALRPLAALASPPPVLWFLERAYRIFLRLRPGLQAMALWVLAGRVRGGAMTERTDPTPRAVLAYGVLGIIPFWSLPAAIMLAPAWTGFTAAGVAAYAALILSFLGGARWGLALQDASPSPVVVGLAMTPTLAGLAVLVFAHGEMRLQLLALAVALMLSWAWDFSAKGLPPWYARLRTGLTLGGVGGLCLGALQVAK